MKKQKYIIIAAGAAIIIFSFFSMKMLSGLKENAVPKPTGQKQSDLLKLNR